MKTMDIIVVNWNAGDQLRSCINSIITCPPSDYLIQQVVVVDNDSTDGSAESLERLGLPLPLRVIKNSINQGFAAACNQGAKDTKADYLLFLNPDTILFPNSLTMPLKFINEPNSDKVGIVGIQLINEKGIVSRTCSRFPTSKSIFTSILGLDKLLKPVFKGHFMKEWDHKNSRNVDQLIGAFFMVRRSLFELLDGFDERFFVYFEEVDFSLRALEAGYYSYFLADTQAFHKGGGTSEQVKATRLFYSLRSRILYGYKHFGRITATGLTLATLFVEPISRICYAILRLSWDGITETIKAYKKLWRSIPSLLTGNWRN